MNAKKDKMMIEILNLRALINRLLNNPDEAKQLAEKLGVHLG